MLLVALVLLHVIVAGSALIATLSSSTAASSAPPLALSLGAVAGPVVEGTADEAGSIGTGGLLLTRGYGNSLNGLHHGQLSWALALSSRRFLSSLVALARWRSRACSAWVCRSARWAFFQPMQDLFAASEMGVRRPSRK